MAKSFLRLSELDEESGEAFSDRAREIAVLNQLGLPIIEGILVGPNVWEEFLIFNGIDRKIKSIIELHDPKNPLSTLQALQQIKEVIKSGKLPKKVVEGLAHEYRELMLRHRHFQNTTYSVSEISDQLMDLWLEKWTAKNMVQLVARKGMAVIIGPKSQIENEGKIFVTRNKTRQNEIEIISEKNLRSNLEHEVYQFGEKLLNHFFFPKEVDFVVVGGKIYFERIRDYIKPVTGLEEKIQAAVEQFEQPRENVIPGFPLFPGFSKGPTKIIKHFTEAHRFNSGDILVVGTIESWQWPLIKRAKGLVVDEFFYPGTRAWEMGQKIRIPAVFGAGQATGRLQNGQVVELDGRAGVVMSGAF